MRPPKLPPRLASLESSAFGFGGFGARGGAFVFVELVAKGADADVEMLGRLRAVIFANLEGAEDVLFFHFVQRENLIGRGRFLRLKSSNIGGERK